MLASTGAARAGEEARSPTVSRAVALDTPALKGNYLARSFQQPPADMVIPKIKVERGDKIGDLKLQPGLTLISLWAPWCAPCLMELRDLAERHPAVSSKRFRILPVLTGPQGEVTMAEARAVLGKAGAGGLEATIDRSPGSSLLFDTLTVRERPGGGTARALPCNLLVDDTGQVLGRQFGAPLDLKLPPGQKPTPEMRAKARTMWSSAEGQALLEALKRGEIAGAGQRALVS